MFPSSMLQKLFVHGSLKNIPNGFEMKIKNTIDTGTLIGMGPVIVDGITYEPAKVRLTASGADLNGDQINRTHPITIRAYTEVRLQVSGEPLAPGDHQVKLDMLVSEAGQMQFTVTEPLAE